MQLSLLIAAVLPMVLAAPAPQECNNNTPPAPEVPSRPTRVSMCGIHAAQHQLAYSNGNTSADVFDIRISETRLEGGMEGQFDYSGAAGISSVVVMPGEGRVLANLANLAQPIRVHVDYVYDTEFYPHTVTFETTAGGHEVGWTNNWGQCAAGEFEFVDGVKNIECIFSCEVFADGTEE